MPKKLINKNEKKIEKKTNGAYLQVPTKLKIKSPSPFRKNQTQKTQERTTKESKNKKFRGKIIHQK